MNTKPVPKLRQFMLEWFYYWINERHAIYVNRKNGHPWPWTDDKIMRVYKFTNAFRELDRGTLWCKEHIRDPYADNPELFFNIATYRRYNFIPTAQLLGFIEQYDAGATVGMLLEWRNRGAQIFTGAHMLCGNIRDDNGYLPPTKVEQVFGISFQKLWDKRHEIEPQPGDTLQMAFDRFLNAKIPGYGDFIVYEVISDLRWTRYLNSAEDIRLWANPGPGAKRGIRRLYGINPPNSEPFKFTRDGYIDVMRYLLELSPKYLADYVPTMEMRDIEHSLCEFDKYMRVLYGEGRPRSKYYPPSPQMAMFD